jgi:two-component system sensor histidine kinase TctE
LGVAGIVWIAVTVALRPLDRLGATIAERSPDDLRPVTADTPQEVEVLVAAINSFMARLDTALDALRNFTGNASHQLRTPLAVVRTQLALIDRSAGPDQTGATQKARTALERAERVLAQLLVLARVDAATGAAVLQPINIVAIVKDLTAEMVPAALLRQIDLGYEGASEATTRAEPILLAELLQNLLTNAITYSGRDTVVTVRVLQGAAGVVLEVEDNGRGLAPDQMIHAVRSRRGMPKQVPTIANDQDTGMGLGLAITTEIAALFGAEINLHPGRSGVGLLVRVSFPPIG